MGPIAGRYRPSSSLADGPPEGVTRRPGEDRPSTDLFVLSLSDRDRGASWAPNKNSLLMNVNAGDSRTLTTPWGDALPAGAGASPRQAEMRTMNKLVVRGFIQWLDAANQEEIETRRGEFLVE